MSPQKPDLSSPMSAQRLWLAQIIMRHVMSYQIRRRNYGCVVKACIVGFGGRGIKILDDYFVTTQVKIISPPKSVFDFGGDVRRTEGVELRDGRLPLKNFLSDSAPK